eukprot:1195598-Prorocentrum_minimum.AAC.5
MFPRRRDLKGYPSSPSQSCALYLHPVDGGFALHHRLDGLEPHVHPGDVALGVGVEHAVQILDVRDARVCPNLVCRQPHRRIVNSSYTTPTRARDARARPNPGISANPPLYRQP